MKKLKILSVALYLSQTFQLEASTFKYPKQIECTPEKGSTVEIVGGIKDVNLKAFEPKIFHHVANGHFKSQETLGDIFSTVLSHEETALSLISESGRQYTVSLYQEHYTGVYVNSSHMISIEDIGIFALIEQGKCSIKW